MSKTTNKLRYETQDSIRNHVKKKDLSNNMAVVETGVVEWMACRHCGQIQRKIIIKGEAFDLNELQRNSACKKQVGLREQKIIMERQERWEGRKHEGGSEERLCSAKIKRL